MAKAKAKRQSDELFFRADELSSHGKHRAAFQLFLKAAKSGDTSSQLNVGYCFDVGLGTRRNSSAAMYWYKRACRSGNASAANNIGTIWRDRGNAQRAQLWFKRAIQMGNEGSNLEIAKYKFDKGDVGEAIRVLEKVRHSEWVSEGEIEQAEHLLTRCMKVLKSAENRKGILRYQGSGIWKGNLKSMRRSRV